MGQPFPPGIRMNFMPMELVMPEGFACCEKQLDGVSREKNKNIHNVAAAIIGGSLSISQSQKLLRNDSCVDR